MMDGRSPFSSRLFLPTVPSGKNRLAFPYLQHQDLWPTLLRRLVPVLLLYQADP